jgi:hypothetical protein
MLVALINLAAAMEWLPIGAWSIRTIILALNEWFRKSELSCDRAGLLCSQDAAAALRVHASLAGARNPNEIDVAGFLDQAEEYETRGDVRDSVLKLLQLSGKSHPMAALRAAELQKWAAGPDYAEILAGNYPRRSDDKDTPMSEEVKAAANSYKQSFTTSGDPLYRLVSKLGSVAGTAGGSAANRVRDWWRTSPDRDSGSSDSSGS